MWDNTIIIREIQGYRNDIGRLYMDDIWLISMHGYQQPMDMNDYAKTHGPFLCM